MSYRRLISGDMMFLGEWCAVNLRTSNL